MSTVALFRNPARYMMWRNSQNNHAGKPHISSVGSCAIAADRCEVADVPIAKRLGVVPLYESQNVLRRVLATLDRALRDAGHAFAVGVHLGEIADDEHFRMSRNRE